MDKVSNIVIKSLEQSKYIKPLTMHFTQNGTNRTWDILSVHDSVAIVIYNITRNVLVLVKQFRPAVYFGCLAEEDRKVGATVDTQKYPPEIGITLELCAGIVDKAIAEIEIAKEEILEECGYDVPVTNLVKIGSYRSGVGTSGSKQVCYYCEVTDEMKVSSGGGVDDEIIDVIDMSIDDIKKYISGENIKSPPSFLFGIYWFLYHKVKKEPIFL
ncbi:unnamed protein product [Acanthoscelides obtectus]|uniref:Uridine diphosphate glucose pyrophosphatase NUDT14 n=1 Tax=Acanthoscelides obtectus TaxID=200917 RepID=A0A9P0JTL5_ACAOB|nr:unnamed protein product [Acanthoscelides obtectus]CAK1673737.1 Uridine diphosphate glucose pyrophosphatase [Acanthoscelides obtectus]